MNKFDRLIEEIKENLGWKSGIRKASDKDRSEVKFMKFQVIRGTITRILRKIYFR